MVVEKILKNKEENFKEGIKEGIQGIRKKKNNIGVIYNDLIFVDVLG